LSTDLPYYLCYKVYDIQSERERQSAFELEMMKMTISPCHTMAVTICDKQLLSGLNIALSEMSVEEQLAMEVCQFVFMN
jgi:hypothetical protein